MPGTKEFLTKDQLHQSFYDGMLTEDQLRQSFYDGMPGPWRDTFVNAGKL
jgi:hypothetical protein